MCDVLRFLAILWDSSGSCSSCCAQPLLQTTKGLLRVYKGVVQATGDEVLVASRGRVGLIGRLASSRYEVICLGVKELCVRVKRSDWAVSWTSVWGHLRAGRNETEDDDARRVPCPGHSRDLCWRVHQAGQSAFGRRWKLRRTIQFHADPGLGAARAIRGHGQYGRAGSAPIPSIWSTTHLRLQPVLNRLSRFLVDGGRERLCIPVHGRWERVRLDERVGVVDRVLDDWNVVAVSMQKGIRMDSAPSPAAVNLIQCPLDNAVPMQRAVTLRQGQGRPGSERLTRA